MTEVHLIHVTGFRDVLVFLNLGKILVSARFCGVCVFHALTLKLPIQTLLSVAPKLPDSLCPGENYQ